jgi:protease I
MNKIAKLIIVAGLLGLVSMVVTSAARAENELEGKRILMVIAPDGFNERELSEPKGIFEAEGAEVMIASKSKEVAKGMSGEEVKPDISFAEVNTGEYDAIVIVGGIGSEQHLWDDEELRALVKDVYDKNKVVSAICLSPVVLARAGILKDKECTVFPAPDAVAEVESSGAIYVDKGVVVLDKIITAKSPEYADDFATAITEVIAGEGVELPYTPTPVSTPTPKPAGFEAVFAVAGLLAVLYLIRGRRE